MLDQEKTGRFISQLRKEKGLTQRELAENLGISDKTISKWETGNGLPDVSMMQPLCEELGVNLNELLSGERLSMESYSGKAEENMMNLVRNAEEERREHRKRESRLRIAVGVILIVFVVWFAVISASGLSGIVRFLDTPTLIIVAGLALALLLAAGEWKNFWQGMAVGYGSKRERTLEELQEYRAALKLGLRTICIGGGIGFMVGLVNILYNMDERSALGPSFAVCFLSVFYWLFLIMLILPAHSRVSRLAKRRRWQEWNTLREPHPALPVLDDEEE